MKTISAPIAYGTALFAFATATGLPLAAQSTPPGRVTTQPAVEIDLSDPVAAVQSYVRAYWAGDADAMKQATFGGEGNEELTAAFARGFAAEGSYSDAFRKRFNRLPSPASNIRPIAPDAADDATAQITGDSATVTMSDEEVQMPAIRIEGKWRLDMRMMASDIPEGERSQLMRSIDAQVEAIRSTAARMSEFDTPAAAGAAVVEAVSQALEKLNS